MVLGRGELVILYLGKSLEKGGRLLLIVVQIYHVMENSVNCSWNYEVEVYHTGLSFCVFIKKVL